MIVYDTARQHRHVEPVLKTMHLHQHGFYVSVLPCCIGGGILGRWKKDLVAHPAFMLHSCLPSGTMAPWLHGRNYPGHEHEQ